jgi:phospholipase C
VFGQNLSNPIPDWAEHGADRKTVPYGVAKTMDTPNPDSGEEYPHVNTQLFGTIDPPTNRGLSYKSVVAPFNLPSGTPATINGFITGYLVNTSPPDSFPVHIPPKRFSSVLKPRD